VIPLFVLELTLFVVLASSTLCRSPPYHDLGRARTAGNRHARDDKEPGTSWEKQLPGERPRETAETLHTRHWRLCAVRLLIFFTNGGV
jgi:hypothetical protein